MVYTTKAWFPAGRHHKPLNSLAAHDQALAKARSQLVDLQGRHSKTPVVPKSLSFFHNFQGFLRSQTGDGKGKGRLHDLLAKMNKHFQNESDHELNSVPGNAASFMSSRRAPTNTVCGRSLVSTSATRVGSMSNFLPSGVIFDN